MGNLKFWNTKDMGSKNLKQECESQYDFRESISVTFQKLTCFHHQMQFTIGHKLLRRVYTDFELDSVQRHNIRCLHDILFQLGVVELAILVYSSDRATPDYFAFG